MYKTLSGRLQELKNKGKSSWVILKVVAVAYGSGRLLELFITKFKSQKRKYFAKVGQDNVNIGVVTIFRLAKTSLLQVY